MLRVARQLQQAKKLHPSPFLSWAPPPKLGFCVFLPTCSSLLSSSKFQNINSGFWTPSILQMTGECAAAAAAVRCACIIGTREVPFLPPRLSLPWPPPTPQTQFPAYICDPWPMAQGRFRQIPIPMERAAAGQNFQNGAGRGRGERGRWNILDKSEDILWYFGGCELQVIRHCIAINSTLGPGPFLNPGSAIRRHGKRHSHRGEICANRGKSPIILVQMIACKTSVAQPSTTASTTITRTIAMMSNRQQALFLAFF